MTNNEYLERIKAHSEELKKDPVKLKEFMRRVMGPPHQTLEGDEKAHTLLMIALINPFKVTNNQQSWTEYYMIGKTEYHVTTFPGASDVIVDKFLEEE